MTDLDPIAQALLDDIKQLRTAQQSAQRLASDWQKVADEYRARNDALAALSGRQIDEIAELRAELELLRAEKRQAIDLATEATNRAQAAEAELARRRQAPHMNEA